MALTQIAIGVEDNEYLDEVCDLNFEMAKSKLLKFLVCCMKGERDIKEIKVPVNGGEINAKNQTI
ncbi:MAG: hypothetical protein BWK75_02195 [Candidatus Altiarchaeales archaeon A3]|nr:MAG: hypothetical protein BWK75_02195 [Candidatus Altiarchaeales archaeon A3]